MSAIGSACTAEHGVPFLVHDGAVVQDVEQLVVVGRSPDLGDEDLDLVRLHLVREHLAERLRVGVREPTRALTSSREYE